MSFSVPFLNRRVIKSTDGFSVKRLSMDILRYEDKEVVLSIGVDIGGGFITLFSNTIAQIVPRPGRKLTAPQEKRIINNIMDALTWKGWTVDIVTWGE